MGSKSSFSRKAETVGVHAGQHEFGSSRFPVPPLVMNSAILLDSIEQGRAMLTAEVEENYAYQRYANPTVKTLELKFSSMERARFSLAVNSGMTAVLLLLRALLRAGDHIVTMHSLYHEISDQMIADIEGCGVDCSLTNDHSVQGFERSMRPNTKLVFIETPSNPSMHDIDIPGLAKSCSSKGALLIVDNTFLTHEYQKPLELGADITLYSTTKIMNGHGDAMGGILSTNDPTLHERLKRYRDNTGLIIDPFSAWLTVRGLRTLRLRLDQQTRNAGTIIDFVRSEYPSIKIIYPSECEHSEANQISGYGHLISLVFPEKAQAEAFIRSLQLIKIGTTFGNLETLCYHFGAFTRPWRDLSKIGLPDSLVRISVGIEHTDDIVCDLQAALGAALRESVSS